MGGCVSTVDRAGKERSDMIDKEIEDHSKRFKRECKILLLGATPFMSCFFRCGSLTRLVFTGSGESGKSTIVKQMKIIHKEGFTDAELAEYRPIVYKNVLDSAQAVIIYMRKIGWDFVGYSNRVCFLLLSFHRLISSKPLADKVLDYRPDAETSSSYFPPDIAEAIHQLWKDPIITKIMDEHSSDFYLMDSAA